MIGTYTDLSIVQAHGKAPAIHLAARTGAPIIGLRIEAKVKAALLTEAERTARAALEDAERHSFAALSEVWLAARKSGWSAESYRKAVYVMRTYLQPKIGTLDIRILRSRDVTEPLRQIAARAPNLARKAIQYLNGVVDYCILEAIRDDDSVLRLRGVLLTHRAGGTSPPSHENRA